MLGTMLKAWRLRKIKRLRTRISDLRKERRDLRVKLYFNREDVSDQIKDINLCITLLEREFNDRVAEYRARYPKQK